MNEVVVTGLGLVTPFGATASESGAAWHSGAFSKRRPLAELAGTPLEEAEAAVLPELMAAKRLGGRRMMKFMSEAAVLGCLAAREAMEDAGARDRFAPERIGLYAGTGLAAAEVKDVRPMIEASLDESGRISCRLLGRQGLAATNPLLSFRILANMPACLVSLMEGVKGANYIFTPWEGQTGAAFLEAFEAVVCGEVDCALVGAADNPAHPATYVYLRQAGILLEGEIPASGAAYLVLERDDTAGSAGRSFYSRIENFSLSACRENIHDPLAERMGRSLAAAPAIYLALLALSGGGDEAIVGVDRQKFSFKLSGPS